MKETKNELNTKEFVAQLNPDSIESLINDLDSKDKSIRRRAHDSLIATGESGVSTLVKALSDPRDGVRREVGKLLDEIHVAWTNHADAGTINALISDLSTKDGLVRMRARQALVTIGEIASAALADALKGKNEGQRWEAAKALGQIGDPAAVGALVRTLEDEIFDVRWLAAEGLITIGKPALVPLLHMLIEHSDSVRLHEGAYHVLHDLHEKNLQVTLQPVLNALGGDEASLEVPFAAEAALKSLE